MSVIERQAHGASRRVDGGEVLIASLVPTVSIPTATPTFFPPQAGAQIAQFEAVDGQVRLTRVNTTLVTAVDNPGVPLFSGDRVQTLQGRADIRFTDQSLLTMEFGTDIIIEEQQQPTGLLRRVTQSLGSLWFNIQQVVGTETELNTPTAVAAIRGTEGTQVVPNNTQSTHALNEGLEDITERVTGQTVSITDGQQVTAIRGVGFTPIVALLAAIPKPGVGAGAGGGGAAGGGGGAAGGRWWSGGWWGRSRNVYSVHSSHGRGRRCRSRCSRNHNHRSAGSPGRASSGRREDSFEFPWRRTRRRSRCRCRFNQNRNQRSAGNPGRDSGKQKCFFEFPRRRSLRFPTPPSRPWSLDFGPPSRRP